MVLAKNFDEILNDLSQKHSNGEEYILGIVQAQYTREDVKKLIKEYYSFWDKTSNKYIDFYWLGYGSYLQDGEQTDDKIILDYPSNRDRKYYDEEKYIEGLKTIKQLTGKKFPGINLFLFQCQGNKVIFSKEALRINISKLIKCDSEKLEEHIDWIFKTTKQETNLDRFKAKYYPMHLMKKGKEIKLVEVISFVASVSNILKK